MKQKSKATHQIVHLKEAAYRDYISARLLMNKYDLFNGALLMNSCLSKELRACLLSYGVISKKENLVSLYKRFKKLNPEIAQTLNLDFFEVLTKARKLYNYYDLEVGFNIVIIFRKYLAEFDFSYSVLHPIGKNYASTADFEKFYPTENYTTNNYLQNNIDKENFLSQEDVILEIIITKELGLCQYSYPTAITTDITKLKYKVPKPKKGDMKVRTSHEDISKPFKLFDEAF